MSQGPAPAPAPELSPGRRLELVEQRLAAVRRLLSERGAAAVLLETRRSFAWLTVGGLNHVVLATESGAVPLLVSERNAVALAPVNEAARIAHEELAGLPVDVDELPWWDPSVTAQRARQLAGGIEPIAEDQLTEQLTSLRELLDPVEHARLSWLGTVAADTASQALAQVRAGSTEDELAAAAIGRLQGIGARTPVVLVAADERAERYRHPLPTGIAIQRRVMLVLVAEAWGLHAALTGFRELEQPPAEIEQRLEVARAVLAAMAAATVPGNTLEDVLAAARQAYRAAGYENEWRLHHQGGSIGYQGRERIARPGERAPIREGMAFAWNPSLPGAKAEETFYLDDEGAPHVVT